MLALRQVLSRAVVAQVATAVGAAESVHTGALGQQLIAHYSTAVPQPAQELQTLLARPRTEAGKRAAAQLRKAGRIPGVIFSFAGGEQKLVTFNARTISHQLSRIGRTGWACHVFQIEMKNSDGEIERFQALGRQVHMTADTDAIENVTLIHCPPERVVRVDIPLKVFGEELCPGIKAGGRVNWIKRTVPCSAPGNRIPSHFELNISEMSLNDKVLLSELPLPEGVVLREKDHSLPVIKIAK